MNLITFRCAGYLSSVYEFKLLATFTWGLLSITSSLMILQGQLVQCFHFEEEKTYNFWIHCDFCSSFFITHQCAKVSDQSNPADLVMPLNFSFWAFTVLYFYCNFGEMLSQESQVFNDELWQCNWYLLPIKVQRMLVMFMIDTEQPMSIHGYGNIECSRNTFRKVDALVSHQSIKIWRRNQILFGFLDCSHWILIFYNDSPTWWIDRCFAVRGVDPLQINSPSSQYCAPIHSYHTFRFVFNYCVVCIFMFEMTLFNTSHAHKYSAWMVHFCWYLSLSVCSQCPDRCRTWKFGCPQISIFFKFTTTRFFS